MSSFPALELGQPGKPACPDGYTQASIVYCPGCTKLTIQTAVAGIYLSFGQGIGGVVWGVDEPYLPVVGTIIRRFDALRVRNLVKGEPAQVLLIPIG